MLISEAATPEIRKWESTRTSALNSYINTGNMANMHSICTQKKRPQKQKSSSKISSMASPTHLRWNRLLLSRRQGNLPGKQPMTKVDNNQGSTTVQQSSQELEVIQQVTSSCCF